MQRLENPNSRANISEPPVLRPSFNGIPLTKCCFTLTLDSEAELRDNLDDNLFRVLMGDQVEPRREFIQKHALDVRNLDV
jgi:hypothetical protein